MGNTKKEDEFFTRDKAVIFNFLNRVIITTVISVILTVIFIYLIIFIPMKMELQHSLIDNFHRNGHTNFHVIEASVSRAVEGANSLSSRTMIKMAIEKYLDGRIDLEELRRYTDSKYTDGAKALKNTIYAERIVDGLSIAKYNPSGFFVPTYRPIDAGVLKTTEKCFDLEEKIIIIYSPVISGDKTIAYDYVAYDLSEQMNQLCTKELSVDFIDEEGYSDIYSNSRLIESDDEIVLLDDAEDFYLLQKIEDDVYFYSKQSKEVLFQPSKVLTERITVGSIVALLILLVCFYYFIINFAHREIKDLEESRKEYRKIAYLDQLTGAHSRNFMQVWSSICKSSDIRYSVVMIDVDNFKHINDAYGHDAGDMVLKSIAKAIMDNSRQNDVLIRIGGDEFLLILSHTDTAAADDLMKRIEKAIAKIGDLPVTISISISYGISSFYSDESFEKSVKEADALMYGHKTKKKAFPAPDDCRYITGEDIYIDGGMKAGHGDKKIEYILKAISAENKDQ